MKSISSLIAQQGNKLGLVGGGQAVNGSRGISFKAPKPTMRAPFRAFATSYKTVDVKQAYDSVTKAENVYLDVRTTSEFDLGHVPQAINVPVWVKDASGAFTPNPEFLSQVEELMPNKDASICVGCLSGKRSSAAAELLVNAGYTAIDNVDGGWAAYCEAGLPVAQ